MKQTNKKYYVHNRTCEMNDWKKIEEKNEKLGRKKKLENKKKHMINQYIIRLILMSSNVFPLLFLTYFLSIYEHNRQLTTVLIRVFVTYVQNHWN